MAQATYSTVRRHLGKAFSLSRTSTGRRSGQRWSEGVQVRSTLTLGVIVDYVEGHAEWGSGGSRRAEQLVAVRQHLEQRFDVTEHFSRDGRFIVTGSRNS
ncbi:hypothetical protein [Streptomyces californicus]|uniref:hypothetical protein n=1 Tax=Streptomyces californicus TaxID=67351 RepID=UPI00296EB43D|nr:hypothetical protein [Streptomyces californicus]MDW4912597.1 hypothetical protein [Streptomyces californicus]